MQMAPVDDDSGSLSQRFNGHIRSLSSDEDFTENMNVLENSTEEKATSIESETAPASGPPIRTRQLQVFGRELTNLEIPKRVESFRKPETEKGDDDQSYESLQMESPTTGEEKAVLKVEPNADNCDEKVESIPEESIVKRISSLKVSRSYQLGKQLSCKWTTGAGPRIGCVRDYPCELQFRALEQVSLSPRSLCGGDDHPPRSESLPLIKGTSVIPVVHSSD